MTDNKDFTLMSSKRFHFNVIFINFNEEEQSRMHKNKKHK